MASLMPPQPASLPLLELDLLRTFVAISQTGNFTTAAEAVFRTPSAVSMQIKKLEETLGVSLFRRDARSVSLTYHGEMLLGHAKRMLAMNNEAVSRFLAPDMSGVVRLGAPDDIGEFLLPGILAHLAETWPQLAIDVVIDQSANLKRAVEEGRMDLALFNIISVPRDSQAEVVLTEKLVWVGKRHGRAHLKTPLPISVWEDGCMWRQRALDRLEKSELDYRIAYICGHYMGQVAAIRADIAVAPLARFLVQDDLVILDERSGLPDLGTYEVGLALRDEASAPVRAVADYVRSVLATHASSADLKMVAA